ncbi:MAG: DeoR family transcriptional regulator [Verrucomicrobia bacterium]|nr:DeoR family transcriptional regulator [Verrucomicrobiota bacterium]
MLGPERHRDILSFLAQNGSVSNAELGARLRVSQPTLRRDLAVLAARGLLQRTHGGILHPDFGLRDVPFEQKAVKAATAKARLGRVTANFLPTEGTVFVDGGTTCLEVGRALLDRPRLILFTNSVPLLVLAKDAKAKINSIGGEVRPVSMALTGAMAQSWLEHLHFDAAVIGCSGIAEAKGPATTEFAEASLKVDALRHARLRILVAHDEKWNSPAAIVFAPWKAFTHVVTNRVLTRAQRTVLHAAGVIFPSVPSK